jgi:hypothetical protein
MKILCFGGRRDAYAKGNASRGASRFCSAPYTIQHVYKWCLQTPGVHLALFAEDICLYATDCKEGFVRKSSVVSAQWRCGVSTVTLK